MKSHWKYLFFPSFLHLDSSLYSECLLYFTSRDFRWWQIKSKVNILNKIHGLKLSYRQGYRIYIIPFPIYYFRMACAFVLTLSTRIIFYLNAIGYMNATSLHLYIQYVCVYIYKCLCLCDRIIDKIQNKILSKKT